MKEGRGLGGLNPLQPKNYGKGEFGYRKDFIAIPVFFSLKVTITTIKKKKTANIDLSSITWGRKQGFTQTI